MIENNFPKLRFENFKGNWNLKQLGSMCSEFKSGKYIKAEKIKGRGDFPVFGANGLRGYTDTYNHEGTYALIGRQGALCGNVTLSYGKSYFTEHSIAVKASDKNDTIFLYYLLDTMNLGQYSGQSAQPGLAVNKLIKLKKSIPDVKEQAKIGSFFKNLDDTISLHQRELDTLKQTKQGFLQKMFPRKGEKIPEIRFTEFKSEWQEIRLGDQSIIKGRLGWKSLKQEEYILDGPALIAGKHIKNGRVKWDKVDHIPKWRYDESPEIMLENGDVIFSKDGSLGNPALIEDLKIPATINSTMMLVRVNKTLDPLFFYQVMVSNTFKRLVYLKVSGSSIPHLFQADMNDFNFLTPEKSEQVKIGEFFKQLDEVIELKEKELEALKQTKQGFFQKMFV